MEMVTIEYSSYDYRNDVAQGSETREFDAVDSKGRRFGASAYKFHRDYSRKVGEVAAYCAHNMCQRPAGRYFGFRPQAMRGGERYGASHGETLYSTEAERDAAVAKYFADAQKRALKNKARAA